MLYFAYGSNLSHEQMRERCKNSKYIKNILLEGYKLSFCAINKNYGSANIVKKLDSKVPGGIWKSRWKLGNPVGTARGNHEHQLCHNLVKHF